ncbi:predicted protein [Phaeodactylum tricornutum CCAP 1055/1]|uniref:Uncharacterized protein n=1 Tax=Phaeodactylum tricornutum (strain CCAP 1055/1) TaxID=556484 RepID=B7G7U8_PHATC|nr:predicted protein [Phaeodactylum tricornutum CCAP 1055/1]EEC45295.1 predicted protein [Phaeodactylum tricornutum CCAP 1055/1]|eukprot:XP_002183077.1 predicted protein [Phaeodactylum tricornutum CCAP 1055/1]
MSRTSNSYHHRHQAYFHPHEDEFAAPSTPFYHQFHDVFTPVPSRTSRYCFEEKDVRHLSAPPMLQTCLAVEECPKASTSPPSRRLPSSPLVKRSSTPAPTPSCTRSSATASPSPAISLDDEAIWSCDSGDTFECPFDYYEKVLEHAKTYGFTIARSFERYWEEDQQKFGVVVKKGYIYCNVLKCQRGRRGCCFGIRFVHVPKRGVYKINKCNGTHLHELAVGQHNNGRRRAPVVTQKGCKRLRVETSPENKTVSAAVFAAPGMKPMLRTKGEPWGYPDEYFSCTSVLGRSSYYT